MAVYTDVSAEDLADFLADYDLGELLSYKGIAEGVENSNFLVHTSRGNFILTLYEKRVAAKDLPFFLGLMEHLAAPRPHLPAAGEEPRRRDARRGRRPPGRDHHLPRRHVDPPAIAVHCAALGEALAKLHLAGARFSVHARQRALGRWLAPAVRALRRRAADEVQPGLRRLLGAGARRISNGTGRAICRRA